MPSSLKGKKAGRSESIHTQQRSPVGRMTTERERERDEKRGWRKGEETRDLVGTC